MKAVRSMVLVSSDPKSMENGAQEVYRCIQEELKALDWTRKYLCRWWAILAGMMPFHWLLFTLKQSFMVQSSQPMLTNW